MFFFRIRLPFTGGNKTAVSPDAQATHSLSAHDCPATFAVIYNSLGFRPITSSSSLSVAGTLQTPPLPTPPPEYPSAASVLPDEISSSQFTLVAARIVLLFLSTVLVTFSRPPTRRTRSHHVDPRHPRAYGNTSGAVADIVLGPIPGPTSAEIEIRRPVVVVLARPTAKKWIRVARGKRRENRGD